MESLRKVASGDDNVAIGISGFGSARVGTDRWRDLANLTGRTTYYLQYDAQELPWPSGSDLVWTPGIYKEAVRRWKTAREGAKVAAKYLTEWLIRMARAGKNVLVVGFSLGAYVAWNAIQGVPDELKGNIELVMLSAAIGDRFGTWEGIEHLRHVVNAFSYDDMALKYLYPRGVGDDETPAAGLGPLTSAWLNNVYSLDLTDMIGRDHLWGSRHIMRMVRIALGCLWGGGERDLVCPVFDPDELELELSPAVVQRLYRWTLIDPKLWERLGHALAGDAESVALMQRVDQWSLQDGRLATLLDAGSTVVSLDGVRMQPTIARRSQEILRGLLRYWLHESPGLTSDR